MILEGYDHQMERTDLILTVLVSDLCGKSDFSFGKKQKKQLFTNPNFLEKKRETPPAFTEYWFWDLIVSIHSMRSSNELSQMYTNCRDAEEENYLKAWNYIFPGVCQQLQMEAQQKRDAWRSLSTHAILHPA